MTPIKTWAYCTGKEVHGMGCGWRYLTAKLGRKWAFVQWQGLWRRMPLSVWNAMSKRDTYSGPLIVPPPYSKRRN